MTHAVDVLRGRVFTVRPTALELTHDFLVIGIDLAAVAMAVTHEPPGRRLASGEAFEVITDSAGQDVVATIWKLPPGTLGGVDAGDLLGVWFDDVGWHVEPVPLASDFSPELLEAIQASVLASDSPDVSDFVQQIIGRHSSAFTSPLAPISEILRDLADDTDTDSADTGELDRTEFDDSRAMESLASLHELEPDEAEQVLEILTLWREYDHVLSSMPGTPIDLGDLEDDAVDSDDGADHDLDGVHSSYDSVEEIAETLELVRDSLAPLADPIVAEAVAFEALSSGEDLVASFEGFARTSAVVAPYQARVGVTWLVAKCLERRGAVLEAEAELDAAQSLDPSWTPVLIDLARFASDRGDAERALSLLNRAGADTDSVEYRDIERYVPRDRDDLRRNDPCWCGSGRRYKACHRGRETLPLRERSAWLYSKAVRYLKEEPWLTDLADLATVSAQNTLDTDAIRPHLTDPLVLDTLLAEGGAFADFLQVRGVLLPDDERAMAEQWLAIRRGVFEVEQVDADGTAIVRDVATNEPVEVTVRHTDPRLAPGALVCTRVVPVADEHQFLGAVVTVSPEHLDDVVEVLANDPDPAEVIEVLREASQGLPSRS